LRVYDDWSVGDKEQLIYNKLPTSCFAWFSYHCPLSSQAMNVNCSLKKFSTCLKRLLLTIALWGSNRSIFHRR
jgi:hypothetical protein